MVCALTFHTDLMIFCRGTKDDFDRFASVAGDSGWSWEALLPFIMKVRFCWCLLCG